ncbi:MAG: hypothetical protein SX243_14535, partial [Acidobacteriota bacterium]|nr:hypothetical protein [Acidobacteriota bacterium]
MKALLPAAVAGLFAFYCGTFEHGATSLGALLAYGAVLLFAFLGLAEWRDAWRLGRVGRWLPVALGVVTVASWWA